MQIYISLILLTLKIIGRWIMSDYDKKRKQWLVRIIANNKNRTPEEDRKLQLIAIKQMRKLQMSAS